MHIWKRKKAVLKRHSKRRYHLRFLIIASAICSPFSLAQSDEHSHEELAKKLSNPISSLISVPFQFNYDADIGPSDDGERITLNIQPVIPIELNEDWNLISRSILPLISQDAIYPGAGDQNGLGDILQSVFFSPKEPTSNGWIWGAGLAALLPTGSDDLTSGERWGLGPTGVALKQSGPWTYGVLANHLFDMGGEAGRQHINATFLQPFLTFTTPSAVSYSINTEITYDWESDDAAMPINFQINKVDQIGGQTVQYGGGLRYWADSSEGGPEGFGVRLNFVLLYPR